MGVIAAAASETTHQAGQSNRSGPNFQLLSNNGRFINVVAPAGVTFDIMRDRQGASDPTLVKGAKNGDSISGAKLPVGEDEDTIYNYYIANPKNAKESFAVTLSQD
jgi:hypothetical protein